VNLKEESKVVSQSKSYLSIITWIVTIIKIENLTIMN
jgi:hypothetical protein